MKIKAKKEDLLKGIGKVITAINPRATLPVLSNILIETVGKDVIQLTGTDLEIGILTTISVEVFEEGSITLPAKKINDIIRELPQSDVEITVTKNSAVAIKSGKAYFKLMGLPKDDFPKFPTFSLQDAFTLDSKTVKECIDLTGFAISSDETRYVLNGALMQIKNKELKMVATDGRRLAVYQKQITGAKIPTMEVIVPTKAIHEVLKNISEGSGIKIVELGNQIVFNIDNTTIISRLIEGHYPNYEQVIPTEEKIVAEIEREKFLASVRRVSLLTSLESQAIKIDILKGNKMIISSRSPNVGESKEEIDITVQQGDEIAIGFNPIYLLDVLKHLDKETITFHVSSPERPGMIKGKEGYIYVIMPMQIG